MYEYFGLRYDPSRAGTFLRAKNLTTVMSFIAIAAVTGSNAEAPVFDIPVLSVCPGEIVPDQPPIMTNTGSMGVYAVDLPECNKN